MTAERRIRRPVQLRPQQSDVLGWQRDFWLALIEYALNDTRGVPDLSRLEGFLKPAVIRHAVTTPDLWHSFDKYNAGKPYHRQVRPFGFMVMFQQEVSAESLDQSSVGKRSRKRADTVLRVIAPFSRDPAVAARHAFDRDSGKSVSPRTLKTYVRALRHYHDHPEAKFLNGERADRGPATRRHIIVRSIRHIGKEANRLDSQIAEGVDPEAQAEFGDGDGGRKKRVAAAKKAIAEFGPIAVARAADISRQHLFAIIKSVVAPTENMLCRIEQALTVLQTAQDRNEIRVAGVRNQITEMVERVGLLRSAHILKIDAGHLSRILSGERSLGPDLTRRVELWTR
jgi:hypothetical protein